MLEGASPEIPPESLVQQAQLLLALREEDLARTMGADQVRHGDLVTGELSSNRFRLILI